MPTEEEDWALVRSELEFHRRKPTHDWIDTLNRLWRKNRFVMSMDGMLKLPEKPPVLTREMLSVSRERWPLEQLAPLVHLGLARPRAAEARRSADHRARMVGAALPHRRHQSHQPARARKAGRAARRHRDPWEKDLKTSPEFQIFVFCAALLASPLADSGPGVR